MMTFLRTLFSAVVRFCQRLARPGSGPFLVGC